jgi:hypothetical protein
MTVPNYLLFLVIFGMLPLSLGIFIVYVGIMLNLGVYTWLWVALCLGVFWSVAFTWAKKDAEKHEGRG